MGGTTGHRGGRFVLALALLATGIATACESVKVVAPDVASVSVTPGSQTLLPGATVQLMARVQDSEGNTLTRSPAWSSTNSRVATVSSSGLVTAAEVGSTTIRAAVENRTGSATITVVRGPGLSLDPASVTFGATRGQPNPPPQFVAVTNSGAGALRDLSLAVAYQGTPQGWLSAPLTTTTAPAQIRMTVDVQGMEPGTYSATLTVTSPSADNSPQVLGVTLVVSELPPVIDLSPASVGFGAIEGEGDPSPVGVSITNTGGAALTGLGVETSYQGGGTSGWLETTLSGTTAPATATLQARTGDLTEGVYLATVQVTAPGAANTPQDISVTFTVGEPPPTDLVSLKAGPTEINAADTLQYVVTVRNDGPALAVGVVLTDTLPDSVTVVAISGGGQVSGGVVTWPIIESLAVGASEVRTVSILAPPAGELTNLAAAAATAEDPNPGNNDGSAPESRVVTAINELADLDVLKLGPDSVDAGALFTYTLTTTNLGPSPAIGVLVTDTLPPEVTFVSASTGAVADAGVVKFPRVDTLAVDTDVTYQVTVRAPNNPPVGGGVLNLGAARATTEDPVPENNDGSGADNRLFTAVRAVSDLSVTKTAATDPVTAGTQLTYTLRVTTAGPSDATNVAVGDVLDPQTVHASNTPSQGSFDPGTGIWTVGTLTAADTAMAIPADTATLTLVVNVLPDAADSVVNVASVTGDGIDRDPASDTARVSTVVVRSADVSVTKTASSGTVTAGGDLAYTVVAANGGPSRATNVVVAESLPAGVVVDSVQAGQGSWDGGAQEWSVGTLAPSGNATLVLYVSAPSSGSASLTNSVAVTADDPDPDGSNDTDAVTTPVRFTVGGTVSGLAGAGLALQNNGGDNLSVTANGSFEFDTGAASGDGYAVTVLTQPTNLSQTCTVTDGTGTVGTANVTSVSITCVTDTFPVGGTVTGLAGSGLVLQNNGGDDEAIGSNGAFTFDTEVTDGQTYAVTVLTDPTNLSQTCAVTSGSGTMAGAAVSNVQVTCVTDQFTVGGSVSGLAGTGLVLQNNGGDDEGVSSNGSFTFDTALNDGSAYSVTVLSQPTNPSQTCTVSNDTGTLAGADVGNVSVACVTNSFNVGGSVTGLAPGNQVVLQNNGGDDETVGSNGPFTFATALLDLSSYSVTVLTQPTTPNQVCSVSNGSGSLSGFDVTNVSVTCVTTTYTVGGTATGLAAGNSVVLQNNGGDDETVSADGAFTFDTPLDDGSSYNVTVLSQPTTPSQTCTVSNGSGTLSGADVNSVAITCVTDTFTVGGTVSGLAPGNQVVLQNNGGDDETVSGNGAFTFDTALLDETGYAVTVLTQPTAPNQVCTVTNGSGTLAGADVANVGVTCVTTKYTVGGGVTGLAGTGLVLQNNGADNEAIASDGGFTFDTALNDGASYNVTVLSQPTNPSQTCVVSNGSGTLNGADVTDVGVTCSTNSFTVGGSVSGLAGGNSVTLRNNGGDDETVSANGPFIFDTPLLDLSAYTVTVLTQPTTPNQVCTVSNGSGSLNGANVSDVSVTCVTDTHTVGGNVTGLATGNSVVLQNNGGDNETVTTDGPFTFDTALDDGSSYSVTVLTQPTTPSQTCTVMNGSGTLTGADVTNVGVTCVTDTFTVGGTVTGLAAGNSVVLQNNGGDNETINVDGGYTFDTALPDETGYTVTVLTQPTTPNQVCTVSNGSGTLAGANVTNVNVDCVTDTHTVGGSVTGLAAGNSVVLQNNGGDDETVSADGAFTFDTPLDDGSSYSVTVLTQPTTPSQTCSVGSGSGSGTLNGANVSNVIVTCTTDSFSVGGSVSGLAPGNSVVLQNNGGDDETVSANGPFTFDTALLDETGYTVTVLTQPTTPNQVCTVSQGSGTLAGANVNDVSVTCVTTTYTVGGSVSGLAGSGLVLQNNGGDDEAIAADGGFTFDTPLDDGSSYNVTVLTQPTSPSQICTVGSGSGTVSGADVTGVTVTCVTTYTVGGSVGGLAAGNSVVLQNNGGDNLPVPGNQLFTFASAVADGGGYSVSVLTQPTTPSQTCNVSNASGTISGADVTNVTVVCATDTFTVGGTVSGLTGSGLVLQNNGGDDLAIGGDGGFTFSTALPDESAFNVTVQTQPTGPIQICTVSAGSGTLAGANVTTVSVSCTP